MVVFGIMQFPLELKVFINNILPNVLVFMLATDTTSFFKCFHVFYFTPAVPALQRYIILGMELIVSLGVNFSMELNFALPFNHENQNHD